MVGKVLCEVTLELYRNKTADSLRVAHHPWNRMSLVSPFTIYVIMSKPLSLRLGLPTYKMREL